MGVTTFTTATKLRVIENIIENPLDGDEIDVLKAIARDLRARLDGAPTVALVELERRVVATRRSSNPSGHLHALGQETVRFWPAIKQALELFGAKVEEKV